MGKDKYDFDDVFLKLKEQISLSAVSEPYIPDILEFCFSKKYLNLHNAGVKDLYPMQKIILKLFYRGTRGNENIDLTAEELQLLKDNKMDQVLDKYFNYTTANPDDEHIFNDLVLVLGRRCVSENTRILQSDGSYEKISDIWQNQNKINTLSLDEDNYDLNLTPESDIIDNGIQDVYKITLRDGRSIEATDNHPFLTPEGWKQLKDLTSQDYLAVPKALPFFGKSNVTPCEAAILGYMTGDGCCTTPNLFFTCNNNDRLKHFEACIKEISPDLCIKNDPWTTAESKQYQYKITKINNESSSPNGVTQLLRKHNIYGKNSHTKTVPRSIFSAPKNAIISYLRSLFACDGCFCLKWSGRDHKYNPSISYSSVSNDLINGVHHLLIKFGITSRIRKRSMNTKFKNECIINEINIDSAPSIKLFLSEIGFPGKEDECKYWIEKLNQSEWDKSFSLIPKVVWNVIDQMRGELSDRQLLSVEPYSDERCRRNSHINRDQFSRICKTINDPNLTKLGNSNILWMPLQSIEFIGKRQTYDIGVNHHNMHNYVANDIISHNSGKDFMVSLIALYEAMKLLEIQGGCPYKYYNLAPGNPIYILTVATSSDQARILFTEIKEKMNMCDYFRDKVGHIEADRLWLRTPEDRKRNKQLSEQGLDSAMTKGSVVIMSGHSNSDSLLGKSYYTLLFDEVASFKTTGSASSGERLYSALGPGMAAFNKQLWVDDDGTHTIRPKGKNAQPLLDSNQQQSRRLDAKIISISSPRAEEGIFFKLYNDAGSTSSRLAFKLPTWKVNEGITEEMLRKENRYMSANEFLMEFGAEFSGTAGEKFIADRYVDEARQLGAQIGLDQRLVGRPGLVYYAHLDPAATSHNYALVLLHIEHRIQIREQANGVKVKEQVKIFVVDHLRVWHPTPGAAINVYEVDQYIMDLAKRFRLAMVSYDSWNSLASIQKLRRRGIPTKMTPFRKQYKVQIYNQLEHLLVNHQLALPNKGKYAEQMEKELKCVKRIYTSNGFKIEPDPEGIITTDDMVDALAGAVGVAMETTYNGYVRSGTVNMPQIRGGGHMWQIGGGTYNSNQWSIYDKRFGMPKQ